MGRIQMILKNILLIVYEQTGFSLVLAVLFMFTFMLAEEYGWKEILKKWIINFRTRDKFRKVFILAFYVAMVVFYTLLNREMWLNPLEKLMSGWGLYNENGELTTEAIENIILFVPMSILLFVSYQSKILKENVPFCDVVCKAVVIAFGGSLGIEFCQLFLKAGTFQISDLCYNTLGGLIGGLIYWCGYRITHRNKKR